MGWAVDAVDCGVAGTREEEDGMAQWSGLPVLSRGREYMSVCWRWREGRRECVGREGVEGEKVVESADGSGRSRRSRAMSILHLLSSIHVLALERY